MNPTIVTKSALSQKSGRPLDIRHAQALLLTYVDYCDDGSCHQGFVLSNTVLTVYSWEERTRL